MLPTNAKPVRNWPTEDDALNDVAEGIRKIVEEILKSSLAKKMANSNRSTQGPDQTTDLTTIKEQFHKAMEALYYETNKAIHYRPTQFYRMVIEYGGVETAHRLIDKESTE